MPTITVAEFIKFHGLTMEVESLSERPDRPKFRTAEDQKWDCEASHWKVTIHCGKKSLTTFYSMGSAHEGEPDLASVLDSLRSDVSDIDQPFEDWASNLGLDPDSRSAEHCFKACKASAKKLRSLLGSAFYQTLLDSVEPL